MTCAICEHPFEWHGDRAVCGCDGGYEVGANPYRRPQVGEGRPFCNCPGWAQ